MTQTVSLPDLPKRVLLLGASGLIGSAVCGRLVSKGIEVIAVVRSGSAFENRLPSTHLLRLDLRTMTKPQQWAPYLAGIETVINCAGVLQDSGRDSTAAVHLQAPQALYRACERSHVSRVIHFSALNAEHEGITGFSRSKHAIEDVLIASDLNWVILRPSVVVGRPAYGGSALFRGLAALPFLPKVEEAGSISVVHLDDVVETVMRLLAADAPSRLALDLAGPQTLSFEEIVSRYRRWLGWKPARVIPGMTPLMQLSYKIGDLAGQLGWRAPVRTTARIEMRRGATGLPDEWTRVTGIVPRSLEQALGAEPSSVQERWFARLFLLKPLAIVVFSLFWIMTGVVSLTAGYRIGNNLMIEGGAGPLSTPIVIAGALADLLIGFAMLWRRTTKPALWAALAITIFYLIMGTSILPRLWADPLGPMMKVWPILTFNLLLLAILDER